MKYVAVQHRWFMHHINWVVKELMSDNKKDAEIEAGYWNDRCNTAFSKAATIVIEIADNEHILIKDKPSLFKWVRDFWRSIL